LRMKADFGDFDMGGDYSIVPTAIHYS